MCLPPFLFSLIPRTLGPRFKHHALIEEAEADQGEAEADEGEGAQRAAEIRHIEEEDLPRHKADVAERGKAQRLILRRRAAARCPGPARAPLTPYCSPGCGRGRV